MMPITQARGKLTAMWRFLIAGLALLAPPAAALDLPAGAQMTNALTLAPAEFARGRFDGDEVPLLTLPGEMRVEAWQIIGNEQTNYQLLKQLSDQLVAEGFQLVFRCQAVSCGGYDFRFEVGKFAAPDLFIDLSRYQYVTARKGDNLVGLLVSHGGADGFIQISRTVGTDDAGIASTPAAIPSRPAPSSNLARTLSAQGHVVLTDVSFATGSSTLTEGPNPQLQQLAQFLTSSPETRIALVGHTDAKGSLENNIALSRKRAGSVRTQLIKEYGIAANRLQADGVGYLSPIASNRTPDGREANRRVEAVLLNTK